MLTLEEEVLYDLAYAIANCIRARMQGGKPGLPSIGETSRPKGRRRK